MVYFYVKPTHEYKGINTSSDGIGDEALKGKFIDISGTYERVGPGWENIEFNNEEGYYKHIFSPVKVIQRGSYIELNMSHTHKFDLTRKDPANPGKRVGRNSGGFKNEYTYRGNIKGNILDCEVEQIFTIESQSPQKRIGMARLIIKENGELEEKFEDEEFQVYKYTYIKR